MIFGEVSLSEAEGAILAHSVRADGRRFRKGLVLSADDPGGAGGGGPHAADGRAA